MSRARTLADLGAVTSSPTELNYSTNVTSDIQAQIDAKASLSGATFTGDLSIPDKIIHSGDTNTAIRFPTADTVAIETGGSERLRIKSDGKVGIGCTPDYLTEIRATNSDHTSSTLAITNSQPGGYGSALTLVSERSDNNAHSIAGRIRTEGWHNWSSDSAVSSSIHGRW